MKVYEMLHKRIKEVDDSIDLLWSILDSEEQVEKHAEAKILLRECDITAKKLMDDISCGSFHIEEDGVVYGNSMIQKEEAIALAMWLPTMLGDAECGN